VRIVLTMHHHLDANAGAAGATLALAEAYRRAGHETAHVSFDDLPGRLPEQAKMLLFPWYVALALVTRMRGHDVVEAASGDAWLWSLLPRGRRVLATMSQGLEHTGHLVRLADHRSGRARLRRRYFVYHAGERLWEVAGSFRRADVAIFVNDVDRRYAVEHLGVHDARASTVPNGIPEHLLGLPAPRPAERPHRIAVIGRYSAERGSDFATAALNDVLARHAGARVTLLGTGRDAGDVVGLFDASVRERVDVVARYERTELPRLLAGHALFLSTALTEGFGIAIVEAMACGLAPVVADAAGPRGIVEHGVDGVVVPVRDAVATAAALDRLLRHDDELHRLRLAAHASAQKYSWDASAAQRLRLFEACRGAL
jgi:glycosyltransferase involved in cell wall biosynthesis